MIRFLNVVVIVALFAAAIGVYSIKYESTLQSEKVAKLERQIERERQLIGTLRAEWAFLIQPERLQTLAAAHLPLKPIRIDQIVAAAELPPRPPETDAIGAKLEGLGLVEPAPATGEDPSASVGDEP